MAGLAPGSVKLPDEKSREFPPRSEARRLRAVEGTPIRELDEFSLGGGTGDSRPRPHPVARHEPAVDREHVGHVPAP
jgi:hypothetical protein